MLTIAQGGFLLRHRSYLDWLLLLLRELPRPSRSEGPSTRPPGAKSQLRRIGARAGVQVVTAWPEAAFLLREWLHTTLVLSSTTEASVLVDHGRHRSYLDWLLHLSWLNRCGHGPSSPSGLVIFFLSGQDAWLQPSTNARSRYCYAASLFANSFTKRP